MFVFCIFAANNWLPILKSVPYQKGALSFQWILLGLVSTYLCTYHRTEEFIIVLANYVVSWDVRITYRPDIFFLTFYNRWHQWKIDFLYLCCHWYATLIKTDIYLIAFDRLIYREIQLTAVTLMTYSRSRAPELRIITKDSYWNDKAPF